METHEVFTTVACVFSHSKAPEAVEAFGTFAHAVCNLPGVQLKALTAYGDAHADEFLKSIETLAKTDMTAEEENAPINELSAVIRSDNEYAWTIHCSIACAAADEGVEPTNAQSVAAQVMKVLFGSDVETYKPKYCDALTKTD